ncbi:MAG: hypothetical protein Faunusvirus4_32 [Faunusvirus sp.]|uniref:Uncharacterized protein n=1 Tax=Faunusvirus sp. TaxID=2487766 RepID=A0A3G4ZYV9_9VIRU|nr:MAG: hypothetical protein Faunusvirus4_32 [Faunusvirus sp.]
MYRNIWIIIAYQNINNIILYLKYKDCKMLSHKL